MACNQSYPNNIENTNKKEETNRICSNSINDISWALHVLARHKRQLETSVVYISTLHSYICYIFYEIADNISKIAY